MPLTTKVRQDGQVSVLCVEGRLVLGDSAAAFRGAVDKMLREGNHRIVLNFEDVPYADSAGVGAIAVNFSSVRAAGGSLALAGTQKAVRDVLDMTRLSDLIPLFDSEQEAVQSMAQN